MMALRIAWTDLFDDNIHHLCAVALIAAMIGPLLILLSIKIGVITVLLGELRDDPTVLEVTIAGDHQFSPQLIRQVSNWAEVAFAQGQSAAMVTGRIALRAFPHGRQYAHGYVAPTGPTDPLIDEAITLDNNEVILSHSLARRLGVKKGDQIALDLVRYDPVTGAIEPTFTVRHVLPVTSGGGRFLLMVGEVIDLVEAYGHGYAIPQWRVDAGESLAERVLEYEKIRLYARNLNVVSPLEQKVEDELGVEAFSQAGRIEKILRLEANLNAVLGFVIFTSVCGLFCALVALFWSAVRRKRLIVSMLSLIGLPPWQLAAVPILQSAVISLVGFIAGLALYGVMSRLIDQWFVDALAPASSVTVLPIVEALAVLIGLLLISTGASALAGYSAMRVDPALIIRES